MIKYHLRLDGNPGKCEAQPGNCPLGSELEHYTTIGDARKAFEYLMNSKVWEKSSKKEKWQNRLWLSRQRELTELANNLIAQLDIRDDSGKHVKVFWHPSLGNSTTAGLTETLVDKNTGKISKTLRFSQNIEALNENTAKEVIIHEVAHLLAGTHHEDDHSPEWKSQAEKIAKLVPGMENHRFIAQTVPSRDEYERLMAREKIRLAPNWIGTCPACGNSKKLDQKPAKIWPCAFCMIHKRPRSILSWQQLK